MDIGSVYRSDRYSGEPENRTIINRIMLRFRPIAPKPVTGGSSTGSTPDGNKTELVSKRRAKRKYVRVKKSSSTKYQSNKKDEDDNGSLQFGDSGSVITLQLLPENSNGVKKVLENRSFEKSIDFSVQERPLWINFERSESIDQLDRTAEMVKGRLIESWVMVDRLTNTLVDGEGLGSTDMERMKNLEADTCPGLISDALDRVTWVNLAYRRMVEPPPLPVVDGVGGAPLSPELVVQLVVKDKITTAVQLPAFACTVRVVYTWKKTKQTQTMPCDVWKMDFGGFAWRFDAKAALSLGR